MRCAWARTPASIAYHDLEWGTPVHDDRTLFEFLVLEGAQAGLSWETILAKRERYRTVFAHFDVERVARFGATDVERLMGDAGIVRNRLKITAAIDNAKAVLALREETGLTLDAFLWSYVGGEPVVIAAELARRTRRDDGGLQKTLERFAQTRLPVRRPDDRVRVHASRRHGGRPPRDLFSFHASQGQTHGRVLAGTMHLPRTISACLAAAAVAAPLFGSAAVPHLAHDLTFPAGKKSAPAHARAHRAYATAADVGSAGDVTADPPVARPNEAPCVDTLFFEFAVRVVFGPDVRVRAAARLSGGRTRRSSSTAISAFSAGVQFDRTASIELGNVPIYFGTTAEPGGSVSPTWHVERDVTDDAALLASARAGEADIFNIVNSTYTGVISGTAYLQFYPATNTFAAAAAPDIVLPVPGVAGGPQALNTGSDTLSATYTLPTKRDARVSRRVQPRAADRRILLHVRAETTSRPNCTIAATARCARRK